MAAKGLRLATPQDSALSALRALDFSKPSGKPNLAGSHKHRQQRHDRH
jgi:hypothetical protein